ncbi:hypothetical protein TVAG_439880 [Trichomonas vaginalis G3]|uniref:PPPDE domain-containing protein n=1 Tax=Trichomonas vaginalis (strain ATCC PRA-98 / G3) TaxID=412133 RepID=A2G0E5_TRIV3|nr:desumoylating isopeptidase family [Trichomonas vaginalis G3]EAX89368.1 hypothetical protein TVAG_439880 [Trichomonas vaginalis G3]KAI5513066.1 desumoylating isopeptidase family [Trichomonas vaginalis G3]|eukprot:XP_001302298.1 hypothetical protein [Trichomonas vaginalis G3]
MARIGVKIYDLMPLNEKLRYFNIGAFHTSIVLNGNTEICYGVGGAFNETGISSYHISSEDSNTAGFENVNYYKIIQFGKIKKTTQQVEDIIADMSVLPEWKNGSYSVLLHNCNSFTYELCRRILEPDQLKNYPMWIFRGENIVNFIIKISISPIYVLFGKQSPIFRPPLNDPDAHYSESTDFEEQLLHRTTHFND